MPQVTIDLADEEFSIGLAYTALSRCKSFDKLAFAPMKGYGRFTKFAKRPKFKERTEEMKRLGQLEIQTLQRLEHQMELDDAEDEFLTADEEMEVDE